MIFISAGHNPNGIKKDSGAVANGYHEANLTVEFRNLVVKQLQKKGVKYIVDQEDETLATYLERIQTGSGSVVLEFHFDAAANATATGTTGVIGNDADRLDVAFAKELIDAAATTFGIKNRGVIKENQTHRGKLGLMREKGIVALVELGFITNKNDLKQYHSNKERLAIIYADIAIRYENLI